ncbi:FAD-binding protein [Pediococcus inopinatus]|uniref:FAD-binding oxidoreductase n=1 Tax=Pediococcus inopinatus TaxID=114090 RepID=UPI002B262CA0|nr:FAD-linked oxidase C-terminal domain-containing protein [Pediococcus inopinatus]WPC17263.1 FAD-binding protein [Pediococcus inopinatus]
MLVFYEYTKEEMLDFLKSQAPHAEIHVQDAVSQQHAANGRATNTMEGQLLAYVAVSDTDDIKGVLKTARKFHLPVIPQSGDTSTIIGSDGIDGGIILSTAKLNHIKKISPDDGIAVVEPGVINGDLDKAARKQGLFYAPDPASRPISTIGGNVATNAGGMSTVKYGATKDSVLGLKVILADGRELTLGGQTYKQAFGYDLTQLFVGSEGTLGIVTEITVRLLPIPVGEPVTGIAFFKNMVELSVAVRDLRMSGIAPVMLEALDSKTVVALDKFENKHYTNGTSAMLIFKLDAGGQKSLDIAKKSLLNDNATNIEVTTDPQKSAELLKLRQDMLPAIFINSNHIMEDMAVPLSKLAEMMDYISKVGDDLDVNIYTAGHAGDGNIHPSLLWSKDEPNPPAKIIEATRLLLKKTLALGGTISGEHAVGMLKNQWTNAELGFDVDEIQHAVKHLFDPMGILNPKRKIN